MTLFPIEHPHRLRSPAEAAALFRALGEKRIGARGFHTTDPARIARLVEAVEPRREATISFEGGRLDEPAWAALAALATQSFGYLDVQTSTANLRIWPKRDTWVHAHGAREAAGAALGIPLAEGTTELADGVLVIDPAAGYPIDLRTRSISTALRLFRALANEAVTQGHCTGVPTATGARLIAFLVALGAEVHATLELRLDAARALTELYAGERLDWQANMLLVDFPGGRIHGFLKTPKTEEGDHAKWHARVDKALRKAGLV